MLNSSSQNDNLLNLLKDPNSTLEDIVSSKDFFHYWSKSEPSLFTFIINHYNELIETGFQTKHESSNSIRCLQIMSSRDFKFYHLLISKTNLLKFTYDYIFNINDYPIFSQKNYFYVLPNLILDKLDIIRPIFDNKYFTKLFHLIDNDYAFTFILRLIEYGPITMSKMLEQVNLDKLAVTNLLTYSSSDTTTPETRKLLIRSQILVKYLANSKFGTNLISALLDQFDNILTNTVEHPSPDSLEFLGFIDEYSLGKTAASKWRKIHTKIVPHLDSFCEIAINSCGEKYFPLTESCTKLSTRIISTTKKTTEKFMQLFTNLVSLFFKEKTNTFLHNSTRRAFDVLVEIGKIDANVLDKLNLFNIATDCYEREEKGEFIPFAGQLHLIAKKMEHFVEKSKTVDIDKWKKYVVEKNKEIEHIKKENFGGHVPTDIINDIKRPLFRKLYVNPTFYAKNLAMEEKHFKKLMIKSPLA